MIVCQDELNDLFERAGDCRNLDYTSFMIEDFATTYDVIGSLPNIDGRYTFCSNHPLGGMDGVILLDYLNKNFGKTLSPVNDLLLQVPYMKDMFVPINKLGSQSRSNVEALEDAMNSDASILFFPAGKVSRRQKSGVICDEEWKKTFVTKSKETHRDIVPIFFEGINSKFFYNLAYYRTKFGIKQNIEMLFLPREMMKSKGKHYTIYIGTPIKSNELMNGTDKEWTKTIRDIVYQLPTQYKSSK